MAVRQSPTIVPTWAIVLLIALLGVGIAVGFSVTQSLAGLVALSTGLLPVGLALVVVYLLYRLVVAVETIATTR